MEEQLRHEEGVEIQVTTVLDAREWLTTRPVGLLTEK
jgi:hypothetical protein